MADNVTTPLAAGLAFATDDVGGVQYERIKVAFGADGSASDVAPGNGMPLAGAYTDLSGSASANSTDLIASTDVRAYRSIVLQVTGTFTASVQVQVSNDNTNWFYLPVVQSAGTTVLNPATTITAAGIYDAVLNAKYLRVRTTAYTSGTATATAVLSALAPAARVTYPATTAAADALSNTSVPVAGLQLYNGSTWDRVRSANSVDGLAGNGVLGAGIMGYDSGSSVWRRLRADASGSVQAALMPSTNTGWTVGYCGPFSSTASQVKSSAGVLGGYMIYNPNATVAYLQVFNTNAAVTGTTTPTLVIPVAATSMAALEFVVGVVFSAAILVANTTTWNGSTAPASALIGTILYR